MDFGDHVSQNLTYLSCSLNDKNKIIFDQNLSQIKFEISDICNNAKFLYKALLF